MGDNRISVLRTGRAVMSKTKYFIVYSYRESWRAAGTNGRNWQVFTDEVKARLFFNELKGLTRYRALSYGLGCIIEERGKP